ncbi:MAG: YraN family protein [Bradymonadaceae bacterium]
MSDASQSTDGRSATGRRGEELAAEYLRERGWSIRDRNWEADRGEIDLVVEREGPEGAPIVAIVEVKTRTRADAIPPEASVTASKRRTLTKLGKLYALKEGLDRASIRFDVVAVELADPSPAIDHYPAAFDRRGRIN